MLKKEKKTNILVTINITSSKKENKKKYNLM
jgi:hypothetical protein